MKLSAINLSTSSDNGDIAGVAQAIAAGADKIIDKSDFPYDTAELHRSLWTGSPLSPSQGLETDCHELWAGAIAESAVDYVRSKRTKANFFSASSRHDSESLLTIAVLITFWDDLIDNGQHLNGEHRATLLGLKTALGQQADFILDAAGHGTGLVRLVYETDALAGRHRGGDTAYDLVSEAIHTRLGQRLFDEANEPRDEANAAAGADDTDDTDPGQ